MISLLSCGIESTSDLSTDSTFPCSSFSRKSTSWTPNTNSELSFSVFLCTTFSIGVVGEISLLSSSVESITDRYISKPISKSLLVITLSFKPSHSLYGPPFISPSITKLYFLLSKYLRIVLAIVAGTYPT